MLLEEFDPSKEAVINPCMIHDKIPGFPETIVSAFSLMLFDRIVEFLDANLHILIENQIRTETNPSIKQRIKGST